MTDQNRPDAGRRRTPRDLPEGIHLNVGLGLGDLFKGLGNFMDLASRLAEEGSGEVSRTGEAPGPGKTRAVYGFSIKMGVGGQPTVEQFGNVQTTERGSAVSEVREPLIDVFDEKGHVLVVAELPGVAESDVHLEIKDDILSLSAEGRGRKYAKEILLPDMVDAATLRQSFQSGILEVRLDKAAPASSSDSEHE
jgi:HSP20 family protein